MMIFLDFDGVLHSAHHHSADTMYSQLPILENFFRQPEYAHISFVISSTWRNGRDLAQLREPFSPDFRERIVGKTPTSSFCFVKPIGGREREILQYCQTHEIENWLALDDMGSHFHRHLNRVFLCKSSTGLTEADLPRLAAMIHEFQAA